MERTGCLNVKVGIVVEFRLLERILDVGVDGLRHGFERVVILKKNA